MRKLEQVVVHIKAIQASEKKAGRSLKSRCLEIVRRGLREEGLRLPVGDGVDYEGRLAIDNFKALAANPRKWGWKQIHGPQLEVPCLVYFGGCGKLPDGRMAGHIGIFDGKKVWANITTRMWPDKLKGAFVPE